MQNTHIKGQLRDLHGALLEIVAAMNRPQQDAALIKQAGISLDRALFPLLVLIERLGPIGVVDLADRVGRDYTTVSRQVAKLESLDLVSRTLSQQDRRVREAVISPQGKAMTTHIDVAREKLAQRTLKDWDPSELGTFVSLLQKFAASLGSGFQEHLEDGDER